MMQGLFQALGGVMRLFARVVFVRACDPAVCSERMVSCEDQGCWCSCSGTPATDPDPWLVCLYAAKNQDV